MFFSEAILVYKNVELFLVVVDVMIPLCAQDVAVIVPSAGWSGNRISLSTESSCNRFSLSAECSGNGFAL